MFGIPFCGGQPRGGVEKAPTALRQAGIAKELKSLGWRITDHGDIYTQHTPVSQQNRTSRAANSEAVGALNNLVYSTIRKNRKEEEFNLFLGGDHSCSIGTVLAQLEAYPNLCLIWVDAHADINTPETSESANIHGMPVSFLTGITPRAKIPGFEWAEAAPTLPSHRVVFIGVRDVDIGEKELLQKYGVKAFSMAEIDHYGIRNVMDEALRDIDPYRNRPIHFSFDVDSVDPLHAPSTGTSVMGGLSFREACYISERLAKTRRLVSMDVMEFNPDIGDAKDVDTTARTCVGVIKSALGQTLL